MRAALASPHPYNGISEDNDAPASGSNPNIQRLYPHHALHSPPMAQAGQVLPRLQPQTRTYSTCKEQCFTTYLGTPGGARLGREGTWGGGPKGSGEAPGLEGTGGAPPSVEPPAGGGPGAGPRDPGLAGGTAGALLCGVGLEVGDLPNKQRHSTAATALGCLHRHRSAFSVSLF